MMVRDKMKRKTVNQKVEEDFFFIKNMFPVSTNHMNMCKLILLNADMVHSKFHRIFKHKNKSVEVGFGQKKGLLWPICIVSIKVHIILCLVYCRPVDHIRI